MYNRISRFAGATRTTLMALSLSIVTAASAAPAVAELAPGAERFSPRGFKAAITLGNIAPSSSQDIHDGDMGTLRLGYGLDENITFWGAMVGSEHWRDTEDGRRIRSDLGGLEISMQYSFLPESRVQPFGRIGFGVYSLEDRESHDALLGGGVNLAVGADYFFSRHWGVGAEITYRGVEYSQSRTGKKGDFKDLEDAINGDAAGFAISLTLQ